MKASQATYGGTQAIFPTRADPQVVDYSVKKTYGRLLTMVDEAFSKTKPLFSLAIYNPLAYYKGTGEVEAFEKGRQNQVVGLIRIQFLKRFESSAHAFQRSCMNLLYKILAFVTKNSVTPAEIKRLERWKGQKREILDYVQLSFAQVTGDEPAEDEELISEEDLAAIDALSPDEFAVDEILQESYFDLDQIVDFLVELRKFEPKHDDKLRALIKLLKTDPVLKTQKVLIFSEFMATARYLQRQLEDAGIAGVDEVDSASKRDRGDDQPILAVLQRIVVRRSRSLRAARNPCLDIDRRPVRRLEPSGCDTPDQLRPALEPSPLDAADWPRGSTTEPGNRRSVTGGPP